MSTLRVLVCGDAEAVALRLWREREMMFPRFVRRMEPDALDWATGAWPRVLVEATDMVRQARAAGIPVREIGARP
jgi:hypothetical protein